MSQKEFRGRFDALLHERIKSAAEDSFRSMSAEIVYRLARSFDRDGTRAGKADVESFEHDERTHDAIGALNSARSQA